MGFLAGARPGTQELEISLFGPGKGEAIAIHLGRGEWGIIDSCRESPGGRPAVLAYFDGMGVGTDQVRFVFATHWHDDHIQGLGETLASCANAEFGCSGAYTAGEFEALINEYPTNLRSAPIREMLKCFELVENRPPRGPVHHTPTRIVDRATVWSSETGDVTITALAPTPQAIARSQDDIAKTLIPLAKKRMTGGAMTPNHGSVVVAVNTVGQSVLLGGDLEEARSGGSGWSAVMTRLLPTYRRASVFKVPHHGSAGAHHDEQWTLLLDPQPISLVTAYSPSGLPREADLSRLVRLSRSVLFAGHKQRHEPDLPRGERIAMSADGVTIDPDGELGHIRLRRALDGRNEWQVELSGGGGEVTEAPMSLGLPKRARRRSGRRR